MWEILGVYLWLSFELFLIFDQLWKECLVDKMSYRRNDWLFKSWTEIFFFLLLCCWIWETLGAPTLCDFSYALLDAGIFGSELCHMGLVLRYVMRLPQICHIMLENLSQFSVWIFWQAKEPSDCSDSWWYYDWPLFSSTGSLDALWDIYITWSNIGLYLIKIQ